jgi:hypothetical protein
MVITYFQKLYNQKQVNDGKVAQRQPKVLPNGLIWILKTICHMKNNFIDCGATITNRELIEILQTFPQDAIVSIECCNPNTIRYNEEDNTIRID